MLSRFSKMLRSNLHYFLLALFILLLFAVLVFEAAYSRPKQIATAHTFSARQTELLRQMLAFSVGAGLREGIYELVHTAFIWSKQDPSVVFISIADEADAPIVEYNPTKLAIDSRPYLRKVLTTGGLRHHRVVNSHRL